MDYDDLPIEEDLRALNVPQAPEYDMSEEQKYDDEAEMQAAIEQEQQVLAEQEEQHQADAFLSALQSQERDGKEEKADYRQMALEEEKEEKEQPQRGAMDVEDPGDADVEDPGDAPDQFPETNDVGVKSYADQSKRASPHELKEEVNRMFEEWGGDHPPSPLTLELLCARVYPAKRIDFLNSQRRIYESKFLWLLLALREKQMLAEGSTIEARMHLIVDRINIFYKMRMAHLQAQLTFTDFYRNANVSFFARLSWQYRNTEDMTDNCKALLYAYQRCEQELLRHEDEVLYKPVCDAHGRYMHSYRPISEEPKLATITHYLSTLENHPSCSEEWSAMHKTGSTIDHVAKTLSEGDNASLPRLVRNRGYMSFRNGRYNLEADKFQKYDDIKDDAISCNFHDVDFDLFDNLQGPFRTGDWFKISERCPAFMSLLYSQLPKRNARNPTGFPEDQIQAIVREKLGWLGRLLYNVTQKDNFQRTLVIMGDSGVGKSLVIEMMANFYQKRDIGVLPNNMQETFGLEGIETCYWAYMSEMQDSCKFSQADFNSMTTGEAVGVRQKHKKTNQVAEWKPGLLITTNLFCKTWQDQRGNLDRRLLVWNWRTPIADKNTELSVQIKKELPFLLVLLNRAYLSMLADIQARGLTSPEKYWNPYFSQCLASLFSETNPLTHFLQNGPLVFGSQDNVYIPQAEFLQLFRDHCKTHGMTYLAFTPALWQTPFKKKNIDFAITPGGSNKTKKMYPREPEHKNPRYPQRKRHETIFIRGVDFKYQPDDAQMAGDGNGAGSGLALAEALVKYLPLFSQADRDLLTCDPRALQPNVVSKYMALANDALRILTENNAWVGMQAVQEKIDMIKSICVAH
jgi:hypothetical protein